jgi:uncharacterized membrane protein YqaE (UPF0057 family)
MSGGYGFRFLLAFVFPPLAVLEKGWGTTLLVFLLWLSGIVPGILAALVITLLDLQSEQRKPKRDSLEKPKRKGAYIHLADGTVAEVVDDDGRMPEAHQSARQ